jgi:hypothetical protein
MSDIMKSLMQLFYEVQNKKRPVVHQLELPLGATRLSREDWLFLRELERMRQRIAEIPQQMNRAHS